MGAGGQRRPAPPSGRTATDVAALQPAPTQLYSNVRQRPCFTRCKPITNASSVCGMGSVMSIACSRDRPRSSSRRLTGALSRGQFGRDGRLVLPLSAAMQDALAATVERVIEDFKGRTNQYDGLLYFTFRAQDERVVPLYIGRAGKYGKGGGNLSANLVNIRANAGKFARWGSNYALPASDDRGRRRRLAIVRRR
jgi:hypothetical protein